MLRGKRERRADPYYCAIDATGLAAIMVVLLAIMMVPHMTIVHGRSFVNLPKVSHPSVQQRAMQEDAINVTVSHDGGIYFRASRIVPSMLHELITQALKDGADSQVYIYADARAQYGVVEVVLREVRLASIEKVVFIASEKNPSVLRP